MESGEMWREEVQKLHDKGIATTAIFNHDDSPSQVSKEMHDGVFIRSIYFFDPDGILLEFACWTRVFTDADVNIAPARSLARQT